MSFMYYSVLKEIKKSYSEEFKLPLARKLLLFSYIIGAIISCVSFYFVLNSKANYLIFTGIGLLVVIFSLIFAIKKDKESTHDYKRHIINIYEIIKELGLNTPTKIQALQIEIKENIQESENRGKQLASLISKLLLFVFWIPLGFLCSFWITNHPNEISEFKSLLLIIVLLLVITMLFIGLLTIFYLPVNLFILQPSRREHERVLQYLNDILYYCDVPEKNDITKRKIVFVD